MGKVYRIGEANPAQELIADAADKAADLTYAIGCFRRALIDDEEPGRFTTAELKGLMALFHREAESVCEILGSYVVR